MGVFFPIGAGGGGGSYINGTVATPSNLPVTVGTPALDSVYLAKAASGVYFISRKPAGLYCRTANTGALTDWTYLGAFPEVNSDANWRLYNDTTTSKQLAFDLSGITASTTRTLTIPNASGTIALEGTSPSFDCNRSGISNQTGGTINWSLQYDTTGGFSGGNKFTVPAGKQGLWAFNAAVYFQGNFNGNENDGTSDVTVELAIELNATRSKAFYASSFDKVSGQGQAQVFGIFNLSSGDEITIAAEFFYNDGTVRNDPGVNWFTGIKL
jgi:hypothetical protein